MYKGMPFDGHSAKRIKTEEDRNFNPNNTYYHSNSRYTGHNTNNRNEDKSNHVLLITVINPAYPITCDVIHQICSPNGKVLRIVIFKKNGCQAMVEFDSVEAAKRTRMALHGCDIYSGCCTLKVEFAKPTRLNVYKNDNESYDYTNPNLGMGNQRNNVLAHQGTYAAEHGDAGFHEQYGNTAHAPVPQPYMDPYLSHGDNYSSAYRGDGREPVLPTPGFAPPGNAPSLANGPPNASGIPQQGAVMMVYGLNHDKMNSEKLFNLLCLYGNVVRVKFLKSKEGCAMVQMGDAASVERCITLLNNTQFFGKKMQLSYSKQAFLNDVQQPFDLSDGSPSFKDFMGNRNNRFTNPEAASKNRISPPTKVLHFFNTPHGMTEDEIIQIFKQNNCATPTAVKLFQSKSERSSSGLVQFETISDAIEALVICNHITLPNPSGKFPFVFKLCFSLTNGRFNN